MTKRIYGDTKQLFNISQLIKNKIYCSGNCIRCLRKVTTLNSKDKCKFCFNVLDCEFLSVY